MGLAKDCYLPRSEMKEQVKNPAYGYYTAVTMSEVTLRIQTETETVGCFREWRVTAGGGFGLYRPLFRCLTLPEDIRTTGYRLRTLIV